MIGSLIRLFAIATREKRVELKPGVRYRATLDMAKVRPGLPMADVAPWLGSMGFTPTAKADVWKANESYLKRLPKESILKAEKL